MWVARPPSPHFPACGLAFLVHGELHPPFDGVVLTWHRLSHTPTLAGLHVAFTAGLFRHFATQEFAYFVPAVGLSLFLSESVSASYECYAAGCCHRSAPLQVQVVKAVGATEQARGFRSDILPTSQFAATAEATL